MQPPENNKARSREKNLMKALVDPPDGDQRRRYVKKWIYGEVGKLEFPKSFRERIRKVLRK